MSIVGRREGVHGEVPWNHTPRSQKGEGPGGRREAWVQTGLGVWRDEMGIEVGERTVGQVKVCQAEKTLKTSVWGHGG